MEQKNGIWGRGFLLSLILGVGHATAEPYWGDFKKDACTGIGDRQYSAILWGIPPGQSWENVCKTTPADINGAHYSEPARCKSTGTAMWGEFDVPDDECRPNWGELSKDHCSGSGKRQYSAVLWNIPGGVSWEEACKSSPADVQGQRFASPSRCVNAGGHMWGEFDVDDTTCPVQEDDFVAAMKGTFADPCLRDAFRDGEEHWQQNGCSNPLTDPESKKYKDVFFTACMIHDYCYALPWTKPDGKKQCDDIFHAKMKSACLEENRGAVCDSAADAWRLAMETPQADEAFRGGQNYRAGKPIASCK